MSLDRCLEEISSNGAQINHGVLIELSDMTPPELGKFAKTWVKVAAERRQDIVDLLGEMAESTAELDFSAVFRLCLKDSDVAIRQKAITSLWESEDRSLILALVELLKSDDSHEVRASAATALGKFAALAQDNKTLSRDRELVSDSLLKALANEEEHPEVRRRALESVATFNIPTTDGYIRWAYESSDRKMKSSSLFAMGKTGDPRWLPLLFKELQSPSPVLRYEAANALGEMDEEEASSHLVPVLEEDDLEVQLAAIGALGKIGGSLAKKALKSYLKRGDPGLEDMVREALENLRAFEEPLGYHYEA